ncbi:SusC/RagA family TonB-linked outer membrane protein [Aureibaculum sp. A20]|uniref:SusC/RagA family TonB-linked outer membrane protein n=1 Tax=Aureibaculum flavum TaxID=2795986 RepID=A0ABS0WU87_9FLAO|nr:SusC/RagA family TonB-linked outer membrane protein [Aureibaculum flavum]MBJ2175535.1 SusC/RagA family TonB-linked outer membrane protein [Aureibaculum flavum]
MRTFLFLCCTTIFGLTNNDVFPQNSIVIIDKDKTITVDQVFELIQQQTDYTFIFQADMFKNTPKVLLKKGSIATSKLLKLSLSNYGYQFKLSVENTIIINQFKEKNFKIQHQVNGTITDEAGMPLVGVTVKIKGTKKGVVSDFEGNYAITVSNNDVILTFSSIGYEPKEIAVGKQNTLDITLIESMNQLEDVVLVSTGYQNIERDQLTGAASVISAKEINQRTSINGNFLENLEGRLPGLVYNARNPNVPADEQLTIRGVSTFDGVKLPLIVIDGFPTEVSLNSINPNTIASVSVLKDASASTIYGARAANGVIVIETKNGRKGKPVITFRNSTSFQTSSNFSDLNYAKSPEFIGIEYATELQSTSSRPAERYTQPSPVRSIGLDFKEGLITEEQANASLKELGKYHNLNEYKDLFYRTSIINNYDLSMSGGGENNLYRVGLNYVDYSGNEQFDDNKRFIANLNSTYNISDRFTLDIGAIYTNERNSQRGNVPTYSSLLPYTRIIDDQGNALPNYKNLKGSDALNAEGIALGLYDRRLKPYSDFLTEKNNRNRNAIRGQVKLNTKITEWLNLDLGGAFEHDNEIDDQLFNEDNYLVRDVLNRSAQQDESTGNPLFVHIPQGDILKKTNHTIKALTLRAQFNLNTYLDDKERHQLSGILGTEVRKTESQSYLSSFFGYNGQSLIIGSVDLAALESRDVKSGFPSLGFGNPFVNTANYFDEAFSDRRFRSYYSQMTYSFNEKYILTGSVRLDQSNLFGTDSRYRNKPQWSIGANWQLHKETFLQGTSNWLNEFKLRAAYGLTGNVPQSNSGRFLILRTIQNRLVSPSVLSNSIISPVNESIRWENTTNLNLGIDFGLFNNSISGSIDWYRKKTEDVLGSTLADPTTGFLNYTSNTAAIENKGLELWLNARIVDTDNFNWSSSLTASFNTNTILKVYESNPNAYRSQYYINSSSPLEGYALNSLLSYQYAGLSEFGDPMRVRNDGSISTISGSDQIQFEDLVNSGTTTPKQVLGLSNHVSFGNFEFFAQVMFYGGHYSRIETPNTRADYPLMGTENYWKQPGDELTTDIPRVKPAFRDPNYSASSFGNTIYTKADRNVIKADQINITDINLTYRLPNHLLDRVKLLDTRLRLQVQNAFKFNLANKNIDSDAINPVTGIRGLSTQPIYSISLTTQF